MNAAATAVLIKKAFCVNVYIMFFPKDIEHFQIMLWNKKILMACYKTSATSAWILINSGMCAMLFQLNVNIAYPYGETVM